MMEISPVNTTTNQDELVLAYIIALKQADIVLIVHLLIPEHLDQTVQ